MPQRTQDILLHYKNILTTRYAKTCLITALKIGGASVACAVLFAPFVYLLVGFLYNDCFLYSKRQSLMQAILITTYVLSTINILFPSAYFTDDKDWWKASISLFLLYFFYAYCMKYGNNLVIADLKAYLIKPFIIIFGIAHLIGSSYALGLNSEEIQQWLAIMLYKQNVFLHEEK